MKTKYFDLIESFLNDQMSDAGVRKFKKSLVTDPELAIEYGRHMEIYKAIQDSEAIKLREQLVRIGRKYKNDQDTKKSVVKDRKMIYRIAALILILISLTVIVYRITNTSQLQDYALETGDEDIYTMTGECRELMTVVARQENFTLIQPPDSAIYLKGQTVPFLWRSGLGRPISLDILNRQGKLVVSFSKFQDCQYEYLAMGNKGVYMFRFRDGEEVIKMGVFYIK